MSDAVGVTVAVGVIVGVSVMVGVRVGVGVDVRVGVRVGVMVLVGVGVDVLVSSGVIVEVGVSSCAKAGTAARNTASRMMAYVFTPHPLRRRLLVLSAGADSTAGSATSPTAVSATGAPADAGSFVVGESGSS